MSKLSVGAQIFRVIFLIITGFFLLVGCAVLAVGIYAQVESRNFSFVTGNDYVSGAALLITSGVVTIIISAVGFVGGCLKWRPLLVIYAIVLFLIILFEIIAGIVGFVFQDTTIVASEDTYRSRLGDAIDAYDTDEDAETSVDYLQDFLSCCGIDGPSDWSRNGDVIWNAGGQLPVSCQCDSDDDACGQANMFAYNYTNAQDTIVLATYNITNDVWTRGCYNRTVDALVFYALVWGGVGIAFGILEIAGIVVALGLVCCITCAKKEEKEYV